MQVLLRFGLVLALMQQRELVDLACQKAT